MPEYTYRCVVCNRREVKEHSMFTAPVYEHCGQEMKRVPQAPAVNWNGPRPSAGGVSNYMQEHIDGAPRKRDEIAERKES